MIGAKGERWMKGAYTQLIAFTHLLITDDKNQIVLLAAFVLRATQSLVNLLLLS
jgi:hypothetical protein